MTDPVFVPAPAGDLTPALYVVATPLGNLGDITGRALEILRHADTVACEDTRHSRRLLEHYGIRAPLLALHEHNEEAAARRLVERLADGRSVALISDAGTPGISDPGAWAVARVREAGYRVVPVPGPNAAIAALSAAGLPDAHFLFYGFLPAKPAARRKEIEALRPLPYTLVFYEAPHRILESVADLATVLEQERTLVVARELTKVFEAIEAVSLGDALAWLAGDANRRRGEFVLIVSGAPSAPPRHADADRILKLLLAQLPLSQAVRLAAEITGEHRSTLYQRALELNG